MSKFYLVQPANGYARDTFDYVGIFRLQHTSFHLIHVVYYLKYSKNTKHFFHRPNYLMTRVIYLGNSIKLL